MVCLTYYLHWLKGVGAVSFENLMEDASTVEICRVQLWTWIHQRVRITDGRLLDLEHVISYIEKQSSLISTTDKLALLEAKNILISLIKSA